MQFSVIPVWSVHHTVRFLSCQLGSCDGLFLEKIRTSKVRPRSRCKGIQWVSQIQIECSAHNLTYWYFYMTLF